MCVYVCLSVSCVSGTVFGWCGVEQGEQVSGRDEKTVRVGVPQEEELGTRGDRVCSLHICRELLPMASLSSRLLGTQLPTPPIACSQGCLPARLRAYARLCTCSVLCLLEFPSFRESLSPSRAGVSLLGGTSHPLICFCSLVLVSYL